MNQMGGVKFEKYNELAHKIWQWAEKRQIWLIGTYIKSKGNYVADQLSRKINPDSEWELALKAFQIIIIKRFGETQVELFASSLNKKCDCYVTRFPDFDAHEPIVY